MQTQLFYPTLANECEIGTNDSLDVAVFYKIDITLRHLLEYGENADAINKTFTNIPK